MATIYTQTYNISAGAPLTFNIDDEYTADESYITQINSRGRHITYYSSSTTDYDVYANYFRHDSEYCGGRTALYFDPNGTSLSNNCICVTPDSNKTVVNFLFYYHVNGNFAGDYAGAVVVSGRNIQSITVTFSTNIPIFDDYTKAQNYVLNGGDYIKQALNYSSPPPQIIGDKYLSAKLNMLRRRIIQCAVENVDYAPYLNYTIAEGKAWVTSVKRDEWLEKFGNLDIFIPDTLEGYPVVLVVDDGT